MELCLILHTANGIQAVGTIVGVLLALLTLLVLLRYADDTKRIADSSTSPEEREMPFITVTWVEPTAPDTEAKWIIVNQGNGPALNVRFKVYSERGEHWRPIAGFGKGDRRAAFDKHIRQHIQSGPSQNRPFTIRYKSLSGLEYETVIERLATKERDLITSFHRLTTQQVLTRNNIWDVIKRIYRGK